MEFEGQYRHAQSPKYDCLLFDLDDTLYPFCSGISAHCTMNIQDYMLEKLGMKKSNIPEKNLQLCEWAGSVFNKWLTLLVSGDLRVISYEKMFGGRLFYTCFNRAFIRTSLLQIFTNGDKVLAAKVLSRMGLEDCFEGVICFETLNPPEESSSSDAKIEIFDILEHFPRPDACVELPKSPILCKLSEDAMIQALKIANINPQRIIFFDDNMRNIEAGKKNWSPHCGWFLWFDLDEDRPCGLVLFGRIRRAEDCCSFTCRSSA